MDFECQWGGRKTVQPATFEGSLWVEDPENVFWNPPPSPIQAWSDEQHPFEFESAGKVLVFS